MANSTKKTNLTPKQLTNITYQWLNTHEYSRKHWQVVATEMLEKAEQDKPKAVELLAEALKSFHTLYKDKVVQKDNLLNALLTENFSRVYWDDVSKRIIDSM